MSVIGRIGIFVNAPKALKLASSSSVSFKFLYSLRLCEIVSPLDQVGVTHSTRQYDAWTINSSMVVNSYYFYLHLFSPNTK